MRGLFSVLIALLLLGWASPTQAAPDGQIAVVDVLDLLEHHPDTVKLRQQQLADETTARERLKQDKERLDKMREEVLALADGPDRRKKQARFEKQAWISEYDFKDFMRESQMTYIQELERIYAGVVAVIRNYARKNGIAVVLQMTDDEIGAVDRNDYVMKVALRSVVYYEPTVNITEQVRALFPKADG